MKINSLLATVVAIGFHVAGSASAQNASTIPEVELIPGTWVCLNNGNPDCKNPSIVTQPWETSHLMLMTLVKENWKRRIGIVSTTVMQYAVTLPDST